MFKFNLINCCLSTTVIWKLFHTRMKLISNELNLLQRWKLQIALYSSKKFVVTDYVVHSLFPKLSGCITVQMHFTMYVCKCPLLMRARVTVIQTDIVLMCTYHFIIQSMIYINNCINFRCTGYLHFPLIYLGMLLRLFHVLK